MRSDHTSVWLAMAALATVLLVACDSDPPPSGDGGQCSSDCDDNVACTVDRCVAGACVNTYDEAACCTADQCDVDGVCFDNGAANPQNACQACSVTEATDGWSVSGAQSCDDGDPCTKDDECSAGACAGTTFACEDDNPCTDNVCGGDGSCDFVNNSATCDDGDACTVGDQCSSGSCTAGSAADCDDKNPCTTDSCDKASGCAHEPLDSGACDDGDPCTAASACKAGACVATEQVDCDDSNVCTTDSCNPADGQCKHIDVSSKCVDTNPCTTESCDPVKGCQFALNTDPCNDNNLCTANDTCSGGVCSGQPVAIDDANVCTDDKCDPQTGQTHTPNTLPCENGNACTLGDTCAGGSCTAGSGRPNCDDSNVCTTDACDPALGCVHLDISAGCDDNNACTTDSCDPLTGCRNSVVSSFACRPNIVVSYPPRGATIKGTLPATLTVSGTVQSGAGAITSLTINGQTVAVNPTSGAFSLSYAANVGANTLELAATDALGTQASAVQSFHWSTTYTRFNPFVLFSGAVQYGMGIWLAQQTIDDGAAPPPTDLAAIFNGVLVNLDMNTFFNPNVPIANSTGYDIYVKSLTKGSTSTSLSAIDGGIHVSASLGNVRGALFFDCTTWACSLSGGDSTGDLSISSIDIDADLLLAVNPDHTLKVTVTNAATSVNNLNISSDNWWTDFLLSIIKPFIIDGVVSDLETELQNQITTILGPLVQQGLSALAINTTFDLPRLDGSTPAISVGLTSDFEFITFQDASPGPHGGSFGLRTWAKASQRNAPSGYPWDSNLGVPMRINCGAPPQNLIIPRAALLELVFADDTINQILRAAWWGGLLEFPVDPAIFGGVDLGAYGISDLNLTVSGWLPPLASDCGSGGVLRLYVGDLELTASMKLFGQQLDALIYVAFEAPISLTPNAAKGELEITVQSVQNVRMDIQVMQEAMLAAVPPLRSLLETELVPALGDLLGGGAPLTSFPLPEMDLSGALGQPPGTSVLLIKPSNSVRDHGNTVVRGSLQ